MVGVRLLNLGYPLDLPKSAREDRNYAKCRPGFATLGAIIRVWLTVVVLLSWALPCVLVSSLHTTGVFVGRVTVWELDRWSMLARGGTSAKSSQC